MPVSIKHIPNAVAMALELDDPNVVVLAETHGVIVGISKRKHTEVQYTAQGREWLIDECEAHGSPQYDLPFGVRMACLRVARDLRGRIA